MRVILAYTQNSTLLCLTQVNWFGEPHKTKSWYCFCKAHDYQLIYDNSILTLLCNRLSKTYNLDLQYMYCNQSHNIRRCEVV